MAYENLCMYCFEDHGGQTVCPHCGRDSRAAVPQIQLLPGTLLYRGRFLVGRAMGQDAGGIVYMAYDTKKQAKLRIREFLPRDSARRLNDGSVVPAAGQEDAFSKGLARLKASVEAVEDPKKRHFFFEENGTGYIAQRKSASAASAVSEDERPERTAKQWVMIVGVAVAVVAAVVVLLTVVLPKTLDRSDDSVATPTPSADALWIPDATPSPTPYVVGTYAPIKDPELSWKEYTYGGNVNHEYDALDGQSKTPRPTAATPRPTSQVVNGSSTAAEIANLQWQLIELGWLDYQKANGKYDSATKQAVKDFQQYMNNTYAINPKLSVDGIAGPATLTWLDRYEVSRRPTPTPTLPVKVTPTPGGTVVNENSSKQAIQYVQQKLIILGMIEKGSDDGIYGAATRGGVWEFQALVNQRLGREVLPVTGEVDALTMSYLQYYADWWESRNTPTPGPTPTPTPDPTEGTVVDQNSPRESILYVQEQLMKLTLLDKADGVYGPATVQAVKNFQIGVNERQGRDVLNITGVCDSLTLSYLEYYVDRAPTSPPSEAPTSPPPTDKPTLEPSLPPDPTEDPGEGDEDDIIAVDENSPRESVERLQEMLVELGLLNKADGVFGPATVQAVKTFQQLVNQYESREVLNAEGRCDMRTIQYLESYYERKLSEKTPPPAVGEIGDPSISFSDAADFDEGIYFVDRDFRISWAADGDVDAYRVVIEGDGGRQYVDRTTSETYIDVRVGTLTAGEIYEISVSAIPINGTAADWLTTVSYFALESAPPTEAPTATPKPTAVPVTTPVIDVGNIGYVDGGVSYVLGDTRISWHADGDLKTYHVRITDDTGREIVKSATDKEFIDIEASKMSPGRIYTIQIGAEPAEGGEGPVASASFALDVPATEAPTEAPPTPTPAPTAGSVSHPSVDLSSVGYVEDDVQFVTGDTRISWHADGDLEFYYVRVTDANGNEILDYQTDKEFLDVTRAKMTPGLVYTVRIGAKPINGTNDDVRVTTIRFALEPEPTERPTETPTERPTDTPTERPQMPSTVDRTTPTAFVFEMQTKLYELGYLLKAENPQKGVYDEATRSAVLRFQQNYNATSGGAPLIEIDPADPDAVVDATTLAILMNSAT